MDIELGLAIRELEERYATLDYLLTNMCERGPIGIHSSRDYAGAKDYPSRGLGQSAGDAFGYG
jgi:hypothetical protein